MLLLLGCITTCSCLHAAEKLVVISPHWEGVREEITRAFSQWHTARYGQAVDIEWLDQGGASDDLRFVESLFLKNPDGIGVDLFFGGGLDPYLRLKQKELLQPYQVDDTVLKAIPPACAGIPTRDTDYYWYGVVVSGFGILYNKKALDYLHLPYPTQWEDLARPEYRTWVGAADPRHSGSMHMMYEIILQSFGWKNGWELLFALAGNTAHFSASASQVARETSAGETAVSLCIDSYALAQIEVNGRENMDFVLPGWTSVITPDPIGILKGAPHVATARRLIDFLLAPEGQLIWMLKRGAPGGPVDFSLNRLSIRPDSYAHPGALYAHLNPYSAADASFYDFKLASRRWSLVNDIIGACLIDCHRELKRSWKTVIALDRKSVNQRFFELPADLTLQRYYLDNWNDPVFRNRCIAQWLNFSRKKFKMIEQWTKIY